MYMNDKSTPVIEKLEKIHMTAMTLARSSDKHDHDFAISILQIYRDAQSKYGPQRSESAPQSYYGQSMFMPSENTDLKKLREECKQVLNSKEVKLETIDKLIERIQQADVTLIFALALPSFYS
jgi:hypothetical protein